ncbi:restriction endonuclease subunit S [Hornefia butyriciproducens]
MQEKAKQIVANWYSDQAGNDEENRYLAEFRDALLPELMSGQIKIE